MSFLSIFKSVMTKLGAAVTAKIGAAVTGDLIEVVRQMPAKVRSWWKGKKVAAIGPTAAGKNSFFERLKRNDIPIEHYQTRGAEKVESFIFRQALPDSDSLEFKCKRAINVGGETDERDRYWFQACEDSEVVFYILDIERLENEGCGEESRIYADLKWLATNITRMHDKAVVHILINKIDLLLPEHKNLEAVSKYLEKHVKTLEETCKVLFRTYRKRVTGITPISMQDEHIFNTAFGEALIAVHSSLH